MSAFVLLIVFAACDCNFLGLPTASIHYGNNYLQVTMESHKYRPEKPAGRKKGVGNFCQLCVINEALGCILTLTESVYVDCYSFMQNIGKNEGFIFLL